MKKCRKSTLIKHDLSTGIILRLPVFLPVLFIFGSAMASLYDSVSFAKGAGAVHSDIGLVNGFIQMFLGMREYHPESGEYFRAPILWLCLHLYMAFLVVGYASEDLSGYGKQIIIRMKNRQWWWISKCIWNVSSVIVYYLIGGAAVTVVLVLTQGTVPFWPSAEIGSLIQGADWGLASRTELVVSVFLLPILTSIALCLIQMLVSILLKPVYAYMLTAVILVSSAFYKNLFLFGNGAMLLRSRTFVPGGLAALPVILLEVVLIVVTIVTGMVYIKRCNIIEKG